MNKGSKTVGQYSYELQQKEDEKINPIDLQQAIHSGASSEDSYENQIRIAVERGIDQLEGDFYVVVLFKKERIMHNVVRQYFFPRKSCPTPEYDQVVYRYLRIPQKLEMIWVVPDKQTTHSLPLIGKDITPEQRELVTFASDFVSGKLDRLCEKLNLQDKKN